jgi:integral membrane protein
MSPRLLFRRVAVAEAVTWALLLTGMFLKYVTETTEVGVQVFGMVHGVVFVGYVVTTLVVAVDQRLGAARTLVALAAAVPPFCTVPVDLWLERRGRLADAWRLRDGAPSGPLDRPVAWLVRHPGRGLLTGVAAVAVLTGLALVAGPP